MSTAALIVVWVGVASAGLSLSARRVLVLGLVVAVASSAVPYSLEMIAMRHIPKRTFGVIVGGAGHEHGGADRRVGWRGERGAFSVCAAGVGAGSGGRGGIQRGAVLARDDRHAAYSEADVWRD